MIPHLPITALTAAVAATSVSAETITVCAKGCDYTSINTAIAVASDGDVIQLSAETYLVRETIEIHDKSIVLEGSTSKSSDVMTTLDGGGSCGIIECFGGTEDLVFRGIRFQNGSNTENAEYLHNRGGAIWLRYGSSPTIEDCEFIENTARYGGAIYCEAYISMPSINRCVFRGNLAKNGGAVYANSNVRALVNESEFLNNTATDAGGAAYMQADRSEYAECVFRSNIAASGGAMYFGTVNGFCSVASLDSCLFETNTGTRNGDAIFVGGECRPSLSFCDFDACCSVFPPGDIQDVSKNNHLSSRDDCRGDIDCPNDAVDAEDPGHGGLVDGGDGSMKMLDPRGTGHLEFTILHDAIFQATNR